MLCLDHQWLSPALPLNGVRIRSLVGDRKILNAPRLWQKKKKKGKGKEKNMLGAKKLK